MAEAPARSGPTLLTTSAAAIITAGGAATWTIVRTILVVNNHTSAVTFTLGIDTAATDTAADRITKDESLAPGGVWEFEGYLPLIGHASTPDRIYGLASVTSVLTITVGAVTGP